MADPEKTPDPQTPAADPAATPASPPVPAPAAAEASATPPAAEPAVSEAKPAKPGTPSPEPTGKVAEDWREARLRVETAKRREAEQKLRDAEARLNAAAKPVDPAPAAAPAASQVSEAEIESRVNQRAAQQAQWDAFNNACNGAATAGKAAYPDFDSRVSELRKLADPADPVSMAAYNGFLAAALETGEAPKLIHALGGDLNEAQRIMSLPPLKMAVELTKLASKPEAQISKAPKPISPLTPHGGSREAIDPADKERADGLSTKAWMERREAQINARDQRK